MECPHCGDKDPDDFTCCEKQREKMNPPTPNGEQMTAESLAKLVASLLNYEPKLADTNYAAIVEELRDALKAAEDAVRAEALTGLSFKEDVAWYAAMKQGYAKGFAEAIALAVNMVKSIEPLRDSQPGIGLHDEVFRQIIASNVGTIRPSGSTEEKLK